MKKLTLCIMTACMLLLFIPLHLNAADANGNIAVEVPKATTIEATNTVTTTEFDADLARLEEIKSMDLSTLSRSEKKELRAEVKTIKSDMESKGYKDSKAIDGGGIYISVGGALIIILLLILLL